MKPSISQRETGYLFRAGFVCRCLQPLQITHQLLYDLVCYVSTSALVLGSPAFLSGRPDSIPISSDESDRNCRAANRYTGRGWALSGGRSCRNITARASGDGPGSIDKGAVQIAATGPMG